MSTAWEGKQLAESIGKKLPDAVISHDKESVWIKPEAIEPVATYVKRQRGIYFDLLTSLTAVDYIDHFELVYRFRSLLHNTSAVIKSKLGYGRGEMEVSSVCHLWRGANLLEREIWDLMGINFAGHPNMKRMLLWENFPGHPLRKDFLKYDQSIVHGVG